MKEPTKEELYEAILENNKILQEILRIAEEE